MNIKKFGLILSFAALASFVIACGNVEETKKTEANTTGEVISGAATEGESQTAIILPEDILDDDSEASDNPSGSTTAAGNNGSTDKTNSANGTSPAGTTSSADSSGAADSTSPAEDGTEDITTSGAVEPTMPSIDAGDLPTNENGAIVLPVVPIN